VTPQSLTLEELLADLRLALHRRRASRKRRSLYLLTTLAAGVAATVALGATYGHWLSSPNDFRAVTPFAAPAFSGNDLLTGRHISRADTAGRAGFIFVWQSYCRPCEGELTAMQAFATTNPTVPVIGFDIEDLPSSAKATLNRLHVTSFPSISVDNSNLAGLDVKGYPSILAFNKHGKIVAIAAGYGGTIATELLSQEAARISR
jgi:thiol-disulfide isomerase/thioredoxin